MADELREKVRGLFQKVLTQHSREEIDLLEQTIHQYFIDHKHIHYQSLVYDVVGTLNPTTDISEVIKQIQEGRVFFRGLQFKKERDQDEKEARYIETPLDVKEGVNKCSKCGSKKTFQFSLQTRSCDEPATIFLTCASCSHRWRIG